ncbi:hypothetical protein FOL47_009117, partial [Perkinsus chesapeaki]
MASKEFQTALDALGLMMLTELGKVNAKLDMVIGRVDRLCHQFGAQGVHWPKREIIVEASLVDDDDDSSTGTPQKNTQANEESLREISREANSESDKCSETSNRRTDSNAVIGSKILETSEHTNDNGNPLRNSIDEVRTKSVGNALDRQSEGLCYMRSFLGPPTSRQTITSTPVINRAFIAATTGRKRRRSEAVDYFVDIEIRVQTEHKAYKTQVNLFRKGRLMTQLMKLLSREPHLKEAVSNRHPWSVYGHLNGSDIELDPEVPAETASVHEYLIVRLTAPNSASTK